MKPGEYEATTAPRHRRKSAPTHWQFVECDGPAPDESIGPTVTCRLCNTSGSRAVLILHPDPMGEDGRRVICGNCQGQANLERYGASR